MVATNPSHPDAQLHPVATGPAADVVAAHCEEEPLKLWSGWFCPFVQRCWACLEEKKIPYQYCEVNPYHKEESFLKLNPRGLVPTLEYEGKPLYESNVILEFLEEAYPNHGPSLFPKDVYQKARMKIWTDYVTSRIIPSFHRFLQFQPSEHDLGDKGLDEKRQEFLGHLKEFTREMNETGPYFMGSEPMMVDFVFAPWGLRLWVFDEFKGGVGIPKEGEGGEDEHVWNRWRKWLDATEERPSIKNTTSEKQHYMPIYQRYAEDKAQSELAKATRSGRGVP